ncbi:TlpA disulfide reductase family protein [Legionella worsleiensis]|uniref:Thiol-disulfide oxidoreductase ResA n=1 Tax=Legionella worsleiensis TaxID=45076 RepID=A0A0W1AEB0_9GAMM|nr:TlpA disulfide reductase family protein [Legionella worsleiensis]KTD79670.1 thiol-disulfide oxidoreductase ResA [Legionella worsleiensis]STY32180.1 thiol-disulfide oxidoreductase [Legionella worsleiensis]
MNGFSKSLFSIVLLMALAAPGYTEVFFKDIQGQSTSFSELKGKWVLINYWAGWCQSCLDEIPEFNRFYQQHKQDPVALYAVNFDGLPALEQRNLIRRFNISYPSLISDPAADLRLGDITGVPVTFIFNPKGQLVKTLYGGQSAETLNKVIAEH